VLNIADTAALSSSVDGVLLVLEAGITRQAAAQQAQTNLNNVGANLCGAVLNSVPKQAMGSYNYYQEFSRSEENLVGKRKGRQSASLHAFRDWFQSQGIMDSIRRSFQSKR
jgi:Mrp family chromosome partitioning ATPase